MKYKLYEVGGRVRDKFLGLNSKDVDYSVVIPQEQAFFNIMPVEEVFKHFVSQIRFEGFQVFVETPDCFTVRAKFPKDHVHAGLDADFVLARKEDGYIKGTRRPNITLGTLQDDLERRDFTVNCMAEDIDGNIIDLFGGQNDILRKVLRTPCDTVVSFNDDPLRILRAFRFAITKGFGFSEDITHAIKMFDPKKMDVVSTERVKSELEKMFKFDTSLSWDWLCWLRDMNPRLFYSLLKRDGLWLLPTTKS